MTEKEGLNCDVESFIIKSLLSNEVERESVFSSSGDFSPSAVLDHVRMSSVEDTNKELFSAFSRENFLSIVSEELTFDNTALPGIRAFQSLFDKLNKAGLIVSTGGSFGETSNIVKSSIRQVSGIMFNRTHTTSIRHFSIIELESRDSSVSNPRRYLAIGSRSVKKEWIWEMGNGTILDEWPLVL
jgi:hypothetical protein